VHHGGARSAACLGNEKRRKHSEEEQNERRVAEQDKSSRMGGKDEEGGGGGGEGERGSGPEKMGVKEKGSGTRWRGRRRGRRRGTEAYLPPTYMPFRGFWRVLGVPGTTLGAQSWIRGFETRPAH